MAFSKGFYSTLAYFLSFLNIIFFGVIIILIMNLGFGRSTNAFEFILLEIIPFLFIIGLSFILKKKGNKEIDFWKKLVKYNAILVGLFIVILIAMIPFLGNI